MEPEFRLPHPAGYSHVVTATAPLVFTSGQIAVRDDGTIPDGLEAQTRLVFERLQAVLAAAGASFGDVIKLTIFVTRLDELDTFRRVRDEFVDTARPPTSSLVQVAGLVRPELLIEIEAVASPRTETSSR
jgi:enamine deaminase RidA (YjgF/YER057c/UK114 family)